VNGKPPAFLFYAADWLTDTAELSKEEKGIYIDLLAYQWINGSLPTDATRLARLVGVDEAMLQSAWMIIGDKFAQIDDFHNSNRKRYVNPRLEVEREILRERREARRLAGQKGGEASSKARSKRTSKRTGKRSTVASSKRPSKNQRSEDEDKDKDVIRNEQNDQVRPRRSAQGDSCALEQRFEEWWSVWPKKVAKARAWKVFEKIDPDDTLVEWMIRTTAAFSATEDWKKEKHRFVPNPDRWLRGNQWEDEIESTADSLESFCRDRDIPIK